MFHVELRQFPHVARAFNLEAAELQERLIAPWVAGRMVELGERSWAPERAKLTVYEGPRLGPEEIGMGRGWANATRTGEDVTTGLLEQARTASGRDAELARLKHELLDRCARGAIDIADAVALAGDLHPEWRVSERLALAEQAVWELLHTRSLRMVRGGEEVEHGQWQSLLLTWSTWSADRSTRVLLEAL